MWVFGDVNSYSALTDRIRWSPLKALRKRLLGAEGEEEEEEAVAPKIRVKDLRRISQSGAALLRGVSLDIRKGSVVGIMGPSGSGKSTFLRALNRLWEPPAGSVFIDGLDITHLPVLSLRRTVGMLFQTPVLFPGSVADNVRYGPSLQGMELSEGQVLELLGVADLDASFSSKSVEGLSVGEAQRVALARALANHPQVLLLDEPTSALDPVSTQHIEDSILKLREAKGMTVVVVSHSVKQIQRIADVVSLLVQGEIVEVLQPHHLPSATHPLARAFLQLSG